VQHIVVRPAARYARFITADGYSTSLELEWLDEAVLAYAMNGVPLPAEHGFPLRLVMPNLYGYKMPKWITQIEFTDKLHLGFWEARGWAQEGSR